jgi:hypothetical protein
MTTRIVALFCISLGATAVNAQVNDRPRLPFRITAQVARGAPTKTRDCMVDEYLLPGLEFQTRGRVFVTARAEKVLPSGEHKDCLIFPSFSTLPDDRVLVRGHEHFHFDDGGSHFALGAGGDVPYRSVVGEAKFNIGYARGQREFESEWMRVASASIGIVALRDRLVLSFDHLWFRVPRWEKHFTPQEWPGHSPERKPAGSTIRHDWQRFISLTVGFRY